MRSFFGFSRLVIAFVAAAFIALTAAAQSDPVETPWQDVITHQIEAFRTGDAPGAFMDAGRMFQAAFPSAEAFYVSIVTSGYAPIMESTSHSFGEFRVTDDLGVVQQVKLVGKAQEIYDAIYKLREEEEGVWRVQGVMLQKSAAIGI